MKIANVVPKRERPLKNLLRHPSDDFMLLVSLVLCQDWRTLVFAHELLRTPAVPALVAVTVILLPRGPLRTAASAPE